MASSESVPQRDVNMEPRAQQQQQAQRVADSAMRRRNDGQLAMQASLEQQTGGRRLQGSESWVEISSQPSSSSLSSIGDEVVTTGLRVGLHAPVQRRRRRSHHQSPDQASPATGHRAAPLCTSSQEEYDETESEEDRLMTSSTENMHPRERGGATTTEGADSDHEDDDDDDENATALGCADNSPDFRPQPNAFSRPPSHVTHRHSPASTAPTIPFQTRRSPMSSRSHNRPRGGSHFMAPSYQADHDAALRASLTTLLSCAAAARALPKQGDASTRHTTGRTAGVMPSSQPMELRLVPESQLMADPAPPAHGHRLRQQLRQAQPPARTVDSPRAPSAPASSSSSRDKAAAAGTAAAPTTSSSSPSSAAARSKRAAANTGNKQSTRATKKKRTGSMTADADAATATFISPTLLAWVVSAGVVVLVSVVGFGAGYVIGREVGRQEAGDALGAVGGSNSSASCAAHPVRAPPTGGGGGALRRLRWGSAGRSIMA